MISLFRNTPVSIADSGQRSLISKTTGILLKKDRKNAIIPTDNGGELTRIKSYFSRAFIKPPKIPENTKEKYALNLPLKLLL